MYDEKKLLGVIGLCRGAGKAIVGVPMICEHLRKQNEKRGESQSNKAHDTGFKRRGREEILLFLQRLPLKL